MKAEQPPTTWPSGLRLVEDAITPAQEAELIGLIEASGLSYPAYDPGNRRSSTSYGWKYDYAADRFRECAGMPEALRRLRVEAARLAGVAPEDMPECLLNRYEPGAVIQPHIDKPQWLHVVGVSLGAAVAMQFTRGHERVEVTLPPRSMYLLDGEARHDWQHGLPPAPATRYSITYRSVTGDGRRLLAEAAAAPA